MLVETRNLSRSFGGLQAVRSVDFSVNAGEVRSIIGPNGAGKTTLASLISGRLSPDNGSIRFSGKEVTSLPTWRRVRLGIAYTFQITSIYPALSVFENVAIAAQLRMQLRQSSDAMSTTRSIKDIVAECLGRAGLNIDPRQKAGETAYGHQRLLEIAMGLALRPLLLILDEPTQGLSDGETEEFKSLIREIRQSTTILLIEHNVPVVTSLSDRITVMNQGAILAEGTPDEIQRNEAVQTAYLGRV